METLVFAFRVTIPVFLMIMVGYGLKIAHIFPEQSGKTAMSLCFRIFLPFSIAYNIYESNTNIGNELDLIAFMYVATFSVVAIMMVIVPRLIEDNHRRSVAIQGMYRSNALLLGFPLALNIYGSAGTGPTVMLVATGVPLMNMIAVMLFEVFRGGSENIKTTLKRIGIGFVTNPLIIAAFIGLVLVWTDLTLPAMVEEMAGDIAGVAIPLALLALGATFRFRQAVRDIKTLSIISFFKMLFIPSLVLCIAVLFGFRGPELAGLLAVFAMPCAATGPVMAREMGGDGDLAGELVVFTTIVACVTVTGIVYVLKLLGYL